MKVGDALAEYARQKLSFQRRGGASFRTLSVLLKPALHDHIDRLRPEDLVGLLQAMGVAAPVHAERAHGYLAPFFVWAAANGLIATNPVPGLTRPPQTARRERLLSLDEVRAIWAHSSDLGHPFGPAVGLMILTLALREDVGAMRVSELVKAEAPDWRWRPRARQGDECEFTVPLSPPAMDLVQKRLALRKIGSDLLFSSTGETAISGWSRAKRRLDASIQATSAAPDMQPWRLNDLRQSFAAIGRSVLSLDGFVIERCMGRTTKFTSPVTREWACSEAMLELHREALNGWADLVTGDGRP